MEAFDITKYNQGIPQDVAREEIVKNLGNIVIDYPMSSINSSNSYLDIIEDYIEASYIAEELGKFAVSIKAQQIHQSSYLIICRYEILVREIEPFIEKLRELSAVFYDDDEEILIDRLENISEYREALDDREFLCPDLVDGYYANLVGAAYLELESESDDEFLKREYEKYPEREYGFWKSAYSKTIGEIFYVSRDCWVVPLGIDIKKLLSEYSDLSCAEVYEDAILFSLDNVSYLAHLYGVVYFPFSQLLQAKNFVVSVLRKPALEEDLDIEEEWNDNLLTHSSDADYVEEHYGIDISAGESRAKYLLSQSGLSIIVEAGSFRYVFFPEQIKANKISVLYNQMSTILGFIGEFAGITKNVNLSWDNFDDEKFEILCYDIIYHNPKFDNKTIRKMGKSRSRDGGRDIVVYTNERPGTPQKMYIFQCKFTKVGSSLTTQKIENISDTVVQYGAQGYGVMTPVVIDAALYDRIDDICARFKIESDNWSILEIERFIARHPILKERHFKAERN